MAIVLIVILSALSLGTTMTVFAISLSKRPLSNGVTAKHTGNVSQQFQASTGTGCAEQHIVLNGETLSSIASHYGIDWTTLASFNTLIDPDHLEVGQSICIPAMPNTQPRPAIVSVPAATAVGQSNLFSYPQCTWWANERYHQLHGVYVPWSTHANAWQWTTRATDFGWHVSNQPSLGAIIDLQPWVQGAFDLGHVAVVEQILPNGNVIASNMNWGANPRSKTNIEFSPGTGVSFITQ